MRIEKLRKLMQLNSGFFEKVNKIDKPLAIFIKRERQREDPSKITNEKGETPTP